MLRRAMMAGNTAPSSGVDDFSSDTLSSYTMTQDIDTPIASITGGVLTIYSPSGCQATLTRNGTSILNGYVEADIDTAQDSGILFRFQSQANFYLLALSDDSGDAPSENLRLFKRVLGIFTLLGSYNATWARGTQKTIRLYTAGTSIKASIDGVDVISVTDSSIGSAGKIGMRANGPTGGTANNKFNELRWG